MKKVFIISIIAILSSCSSSVFGGDEPTIEEIEKAKIEAIEAIGAAAKDASAQITNDFTAKLGDANVQIDSAINDAKTSISNNVKDEVNKEVSEKFLSMNKDVQNVNEKVQRAKMIGLIGIIVGFIGICFSVFILIMRTRSESRVCNIVAEAVLKDKNFRDHLKENLSIKSPSGNQLTSQDVSALLSPYIKSKQFQDYIVSICKAINITPNTPPNIKTVETAHDQQPVQVARKIELFAREGLKNVSPTFEKGKTLYKLMLDEQTSRVAIISIADETEVHKRILQLDNQYLEPICEVSRSSNPTVISVKETGTAELNGGEWSVVKPIKVEIK